ncbi:MAG: efflux RND transporter permease subunit [Verrucomicrobiae bacterium]|nr:efflux RND transporter permease subunit [Verrucomicrobiae bacterium]
MIRASVNQPISVAVGVLLSIFAGLLAVSRVPIRMTPEIESVVVSVITNWESASAEEIESDIVEEQEKVLGEVTGLRSMISTSSAGQGTIRLEFETGTDIEEAKADVLQKLDEVPGYPTGVLQPVVDAVDPESVDYISWIGLASTDPDFDAATLADFMERRMKPRFERLPGISQVGIRGARQSELHIIVDPRAMAVRGITFSQLRQAIESANVDISAGRLEEGKRDIRVRTIGRFQAPEDISQMVIFRDESGPVYLGDIATIEESFKEPTDWARARGFQMPFFNFQLARGANLLETMGFLMDEVEAMNAPGGILEQKAKELGINGRLELVNTYDSTTYVRDAIDLVQSNIIVGGILATLTLLFFLRSFRSVGIIAVAIPVSVIASFVVLVGLGRSINIISLAGLAFAVGMVVDNAIVVIENIYRHLEMGKPAPQAALDGSQEVAGAVVASTMTTLVVFFPILLIQETAGQLFRDISLAIMSAVGLSMVVSLTLIPAAAARFLHRSDADSEIGEEENLGEVMEQNQGAKKWLMVLVHPFAKFLHRLPNDISRVVSVVTESWPRRIAVIFLGLMTVVGSAILKPERDYLPSGNRDVVFGMLFPPPGYNLDQLSAMGRRIEDRVKPAWEATPNKFGIEDVVEKAEGKSTEPHDDRKPVPLGYGQEGTVMPPPLKHYFLVSFEGRMFHGAISADKKRVVDAVPLLNMATSGAAAPDTIAFAFQAPLFRVGGLTGSAIQIDLTGDDLDEVGGAAGALFGSLMKEFGPGAARPEPPNFALPLHELQVVPRDERLRELGMTRADLGLAVQANGDGILLFRQFEQNGELKDMKILSEYSRTDDAMEALLEAPIATPLGSVVDFKSVADLKRVRGPDMIRHVDRLRAVTVELTPPRGQPLEVAIDRVQEQVDQLRKAGAIPHSVGVELSGSAGKLAEITEALLGDGTLFGTLSSSLVMAFLVVYLLMVVLFQSWTYPLVIMLSVPLATFGGFLGLALVHWWSVTDRYSPVQNLDMLTILGFVILAGVVVNNAILIVHQTLNFLRDDPDLDPQEAIRESVKSRVRPILMSTLTSVGGMLPLVLLPGAGSELYRGLGAVVVGGLMVSTVFTLFLVPTVLSAMFAVRGEEKVREQVSQDEGESSGEPNADPITA